VLIITLSITARTYSKQKIWLKGYLNIGFTDNAEFQYFSNLEKQMNIDNCFIYKRFNKFISVYVSVLITTKLNAII